MPGRRDRWFAITPDQITGRRILRSTAKEDAISKVVDQLNAGEVVTTLKNTVDHVVTEWGVASLRGRSIRERADALIGVAHPCHRDPADGRSPLPRLPVEGDIGMTARIPLQRVAFEVDGVEEWTRGSARM